MAASARKIRVPPAQTPGTQSSQGGRRVAIDYLRTFVIVLVLVHHSALAYVHFGHFNPVHYLWSTAPIIDNHRWLGFDLIVLFNDIFFMSLMFFVSGLFVWPSLARKGAASFTRDRFLRLGLPFALAVLFLMPLAFYPSFRMTGAHLGFVAFWEQSISLKSWPVGPAWFIWILLAFDCVAALLQWIAPDLGQTIANRGAKLFASSFRYFTAVIAITAIAYLPMLLIFGPTHWFSTGPLIVQASRVLLYAAWFFAGVAVGAYGIERSAFSSQGAMAHQWFFWMLTGFAAFQVIIWMQIHQQTAAIYGLAFVVACAAIAFAFIAIFLRFATRRIAILDSLNDNSYGIYIVHYMFVVWLQYALLNANLPAIAKASIVFGSVLMLSWGSVAIVRRIPAVARII